MALLLAVLFVIYLAWSWLAVPTAALKNTSQGQQHTATTAAASVAWPSTGQAAIGTDVHGILASHGSQTGVPIASVAKVMLALAVIERRPFSSDSAGATITLTQADVDSYSSWLAKDGSVLPVAAGEQLSEYQALQGLLLPSANNMADTLATWAFGSIEAYERYANDFADHHHMNATHFADASGFDPATVSSATDLVTLGRLALQKPVISDIASQRSAVLPVAGTVYNVNSLLGKNGIDGLKTGNTDQAGGCLLFTADSLIGGKTVQLVGAVLGAPNLSSALGLSSKLLSSADTNLTDTVVTPKDTSVATFRLPWGESVQAVTNDDLHSVVWGGSDVATQNSFDAIRLPARDGQIIGKRVVTSNAINSRSSVPLILRGNLQGPSLLWRVMHPIDTWRLRFAG